VPLHLVSAWAQANRLVLAQTAVDDKSNASTAIPELLRMLCLKGCIVTLDTLDAMGCQKAIARQIRKQGADYVLRVRANHKGLPRRLEDTFALARATGFAAYAHDYADTVGKDHGHIETRRFWTTGDPALRDVVNAASHVLRTGCSWRVACPMTCPAGRRSTATFARGCGRLWERIHEALQPRESVSRSRRRRWWSRRLRTGGHYLHSLHGPVQTIDASSRNYKQRESKQPRHLPGLFSLTVPPEGSGQMVMATWPQSHRRHRDKDRNPSGSRRCPTSPIRALSKCALLFVSWFRFRGLLQLIVEVSDNDTLVFIRIIDIGVGTGATNCIVVAKIVNSAYFFVSTIERVCER